MSDPILDIAFWSYDRTRKLTDGSVGIAGAQARFHTARIVPDIFAAMIRDRAYDVSELGLTYFLRTMDQDDPPFLAIPVFLNRAFRHAAIYVNTARGIAQPADLAGKTIGELALYGHDAGVMAKGMLADEYGISPAQCRWVIGGIDFPMQPIDFVPHPHPPGLQVEWAPPGADLGAMLEAGTIDALISADVPRCVLQGSPKVARLFPNYPAAEQDYFRRTGIFPIMHTVVVRKTLAPGLARAVYDGFCQAKAAVMDEYVRSLTFNAMGTMIPWMGQLIEANRALLGDDWWPYGLAANRKAIDAYLRHHFEQGLSRRRMTCEEIFVPALLDT